jgi:hypothetical protein
MAFRERGGIHLSRMGHRFYCGASFWHLDLVLVLVLVLRPVVRLPSLLMVFHPLVGRVSW